MFIQKIIDKLFWKHQFNEIWMRHLRVSSDAHRIFKFEELDKQKYFWREKKGRRYRFSPRKAAYQAFKELADKWYKNKEYKNEQELHRVALILEDMFPFIDENGEYQDVKELLDEPWKGLAKKSWDHWKAEKIEAEVFAKEIELCRFDIEEVNKAWKSIKSGDIPVVASKIWEASYPRKWAKDIIIQANVSLEDFCFWMCVFKLHLGYTEQVVLGKHMYLATNKSLSDELKSKNMDDNTSG